MIPRALEPALLKAMTTLPVVSLTGPRQSGKSTLLKSLFPACRYVSLENPLVLAQAKDDPEGFLDDIGFPVIIDEAQHFPELFSYIQIRVDEINQAGMYILSGSQNFLMMEAISQSLAGRVTILRLYPFSAEELIQVERLPKSTEDWIFTGGYPRLYDKGIAPIDYYPSYIETYLQRDVMMLRRIGDLSTFVRFLQILAGRVGQLLVYQEVANDADISVDTVKSWFSVLETSYVIFTLRPLHKNVTSRSVKSSKLYFWDTGLVCALLGLTDAGQLRSHYLYGALFENMVISETRKQLNNVSSLKTAQFWRNNKKQEVDLLIKADPSTIDAALEIKSSRSAKLSHFATLDKVGDLLEVEPSSRFVVYDGDEQRSFKQHGIMLPWQNLPAALRSYSILSTKD